MDEKASRRDMKATNSHVRWLTEPTDRAMLVKIIELLLSALDVEDTWRAVEYLMVARALSKILEEVL